MRAWRLYGRRACVLSSSWAALKNVAANPSATPPPTTTSSRSSRVHSDASAAADEPPGALHDLVRRLGRRAPVIASMARPDASASRQPAGAAAAAAAVGLDDDVADVAGVGRRAVEQLAVEHDAAADAGRDRQHAVVVVALGRALPALGQGQRLAVEVAVDAGAGELLEPGAQRELPPGRDVDRRHRLAVAGDRSGRADADAGDAHLVALGGLELLLDDAGERLEVGLRADVLVDEDDGAVEQLAAHRRSGRRRTWCRRCRRRARPVAGAAAAASARCRRLWLVSGRCGVGVVIRCVVFVRIQTTSREG